MMLIALITLLQSRLVIGVYRYEFRYFEQEQHVCLSSVQPMELREHLTFRKDV